MARPGCALELVGEMLPHERRFLAWLNTTDDPSSDRGKIARRMGLSTSDAQGTERRVLGTYRKFRDIWGILKAYREGKPLHSARSRCKARWPTLQDKAQRHWPTS